LDFAVSILALHKLGAVCLLVDTKSQSQRNNYIVKHSQAKLVLFSGEKTYGIDPSPNQTLDLTQISPKDYPKSRPQTRASSQDPAFLIYTSGSTGEPKGAELSHQGVACQVSRRIDIFDIGNKDHLCLSMATNFIPTVFQFYTPLITGATLHIYPENLIKDCAALFRQIERDKIGLFDISTVMLETFLNHYQDKVSSDFTSLKYLLPMGNKLKPRTAKSFFKRFQHTQLVNNYGMTENSGPALLNFIDSRKTDRITEGKPLPNTQTYILDQNLNLLPPGVPGELYISGHGLARGYLNDEKKTQEVFLPHPFQKGQRIYKTGDRAKLHPDGNIEILGRTDDQVKIRGQRVEPAEIENALRKHSGIKEAVVIARNIQAKDEKTRDKTLVAYYTTQTKKNPGTQDIKNRLKDLLPDYMVPAYFIPLKEFPLNQNGKIDKKNLPDPEEKDLVKKQYQPPQTDTEKKLARIWQEVLGVEKISRYDSFFDLGGHSLKAIRMLSRLNKEFARDISLKNLFLYPVLKDLARHIDQEKKKDTIQIPQAPKDKPHYALSHSQKRLFILYKLEPDSPFYNINNIRKLTGHLNIPKFRQALNILGQRHETLRTNFREIGGEPVQVIHSEPTAKLKTHDLSQLPPKEREKKKQAIIQKTTQTPFKLEEEPLLRAVVLKEGKARTKNQNKNKEKAQEQYTLIIALHHIISDAWSMAIFYQELSHIYNQLLKGQEPRLPELPIQYKDYAEWERSEANEKRLKQQEKYWLKELS
ncbi:MAG TPA: AMP-binding protein, partial [Patescibacteria group bacterium]|nr:AMP-binding protein [Patescibacteria group bacterium]